jgi:DNA polymerase I-like protein with 3'-5' exonuclease and polymerase domains
MFLHRDFDGQEMRVFAHYEDGDLLQMYNDDPDMCPHEYVRDAIIEMFDIPMEKSGAKTLNFQGLYGGGIPALMKKLDCSNAQAKKFKKYHNEVLPGKEALNATIKELINEGEPIRTWGNRAYFVEPPRVVNGRMQSFLYKLINYLCQGSAADITKEAIIRWYEHPEREARFLVTVYDEINVSAKKREAEHQMKVLKESMESIELDLKMTSSGKMGLRWGALEACA